VVAADGSLLGMESPVVASDGALLGIGDALPPGIGSTTLGATVGAAVDGALEGILVVGIIEKSIMSLVPQL